MAAGADLVEAPWTLQPKKGTRGGRKEGRQVTIITNEREIVMWPEFGAMQRHFILQRLRVRQ